MIVFISGPYRARTIFGRMLNIYRAWRAARDLWRTGHTVICPHANSALMEGAAPDEHFLAGDLEILKRCDALYLMLGWWRSEGARMELQKAKEWGKVIL